MCIRHVACVVAGCLVSVSEMSIHAQIRAAAVLDAHLGETSEILKPSIACDFLLVEMEWFLHHAVTRSSGVW